MSLNDSNGLATGATLTLDRGTALDGIPMLAGPVIWDTESTVDPVLTPVDRLYNSAVGAGGGRAAEFALQNIPYATYDLYVYLSFSIYQGGSIQLFQGGTADGAQDPLYYRSGMSWNPLNVWAGTVYNTPDSGYTQVTSTDPVVYDPNNNNNPASGGTPTGNSGAYVEFTGLTGPNQTLDFAGGGGVAGIQIVSAAVPEPTTWASVILGAAGLLAFRRRRA